MGQQQLLLILIGIVAVGVAIAIGIGLYAGQSVINNKDNLLNSINYVSADAWSYYQRANIMGGGSGSFTGYRPPMGLRSNDDGTIDAFDESSGKSLRIVGTSRYGYGTVTIVEDQSGSNGTPTYTGQFSN